MSNAVGGQAVIEGVMMRNGERMAIAIRTTDQRREIIVHNQLWESVESPFRKTLFIRGMFGMYEAIKNGVKAVRWSGAKNAGENARYGEVSGGYVLASLGLTFALFIALPQLLVFLLGTILGIGWMAAGSSLGFHLVVGATKIAVFIGYLWLLGSMRDGHRLFAYHGAEHKVINAYEKGLSLTADHAKLQSRIHPRCGTSFMFIAIMMSIVIYTLLFPLIGFDNQALVLVIKLALLPLLAGASYEFLLKFGPRLPPALWMQYITTREPTVSQIEVALAALKAVTR